MTLGTVDFTILQIRCRRASIGKKLPDALYVHYSAVEHLDPDLQAYERAARQVIADLDFPITLIKFNTTAAKVSYLYYPDFDQNPHPALNCSLQVEVDSKTYQIRHYGENPPILHRKETFVAADYPLYSTFTALTQAEEKLGLLANSRYIGHRSQWEEKLRQHGVRIAGHQLIAENIKTGFNISIERHKAAIIRRQLSRPVRVALEAELFTSETTFFDYGCGHGEDLQFIAEKGFIAQGWDPYYQPQSDRQPADIVNLGYVINVIEDATERREAMLNAWALTRQVLIVAAQVTIADSGNGQIAYADGVVTRRNTFQKYYDQEELKNYIDQVLGVDAVPVALGIYFIFRDEAQAEAFRASRFRSRTIAPRIRLTVKQFEDYRELLQPLIDFVTERGRLPKKGELPEEADICHEFHSLTQAFRTIVQATDEQDWEHITEQRRMDIQIYLALSQFAHRPRLSQLSPVLQTDIKVLFGTYKQACLLADMMLFSLGDLENIADIAAKSSIGICSRKALLVHVSALDSLNPLLRLYEGCASRTVGRLESVTLVRFYLTQPKIAYIYCPNFDTDPHPKWEMAMQIELPDLKVRYRDYGQDNSPVVQRKDKLVTKDYADYEKFAKLSQQEADWGLLEDWSKIQLWQGWQQQLEAIGAEVKGHRLHWRKDGDPYQKQLIKSQIRAKQRQRQAREEIESKLVDANSTELVVAVVQKEVTKLDLK